jgi:hypothetical protein
MYNLTRQAIATLMTSGQSVSYQGRSLTMANLAQLQAAELYYKNLMDQDLMARPARNRLVYVYPML